MKILISAYSCEPGVGSERGVGWNVAVEASKYNQVWVLTRPDESRQAIEAELERNPNPNLHFVYFTLPFWKDSLRWGQSGAMQIHYYLWQIQAYFIAKSLNEEVKFDVTHHVTFVKYSSPSFLVFLPVPFIWGPVGGGESSPLAFWADFSLKNKLYESLRWLWRSIGELDPFVRKTAQRSAITYAVTEDTAFRMRKMGASAVKVSSGIALSNEELKQLSQCSLKISPSIKFVSIGRLLHWKGFHLGLRAFAEANISDAEYWLIGEGAELMNLKALAEKLGIAHKVKILGSLTRSEVLSKIGECSILVHPSLHESGGFVCLEAMAAKRPVICLDLGGPAEQVTAVTGIKVPAKNPSQAVTDLAKAMNSLAQDEQLRLRMGELGHQRVNEHYSWTAKGKQFTETYQKIVT